MNGRAWMSAVIVVVLTAVLTVPAFAGPWGGQGSGGWGAGGAYQRMYDPATVETISGKVVGIDLITPARGMSNGIHLRVRTDKETIPVQLGPAWYLERQDTKIRKGDTVEVKGSRVSFNGKPALIAAQVKKGDAVLNLRDDNGYPAWAGWRRK